MEKRGGERAQQITDNVTEKIAFFRRILGLRKRLAPHSGPPEAPRWDERDNLRTLYVLGERKSRAQRRRGGVGGSTPQNYPSNIYTSKITQQEVGKSGEGASLSRTRLRDACCCEQNEGLVSSFFWAANQTEGGKSGATFAKN